MKPVRVIAPEVDLGSLQERQPKRSAKTQSAMRAKIALFLTVALGIGIPLMSLSLSMIAGRLLEGSHLALASASLLLCGTVLFVSLQHLAWAICDITKSGAKCSWAMAVSIDLALVLCELCQVFARESGIETITTVLMWSVCVCSMALNVWAFLRHHK